MAGYPAYLWIYAKVKVYSLPDETQGAGQGLMTSLLGEGIAATTLFLFIVTLLCCQADGVGALHLGRPIMPVSACTCETPSSVLQTAPDPRDFHPFHPLGRHRSSGEDPLGMSGLVQVFPFFQSVLESLECG